MSPVSDPTLLWTLIIRALATVLACTLVLDAEAMTALMRGKEPRANPFLSPRLSLIKGNPYRLAWPLLAVFGLIPLFMSGPFGIWGLLPDPTQTAVMTTLAILIGLLFLAEWRDWKRIGAVAAVLVMVVMLSPYALAGPAGGLKYAVIVGITTSILLFMTLAYLAYRLMMNVRPKTRIGAGIRLVADVVVAIASLGIAFWRALGAA
jgi:hypothetical protein